MNSTGKTVAKNAGVLMISQVITWGLTLLLTTAMSRSLGAPAMGKFYLASSLWGIITIFATFGMDLMIIKEIARFPEKTPKLLGTSLYLRTGFYILGTIAILIYSNLVSYPADTLMVIYLIGAANLLMQYVGIGEMALKGLERMTFVSVGGIANKVFVTLVTIIILWLGYGVEVAATVAVGAGLVNFLVIVYAIWRNTTVDLRFDRLLAANLLVQSLPYLAVNIVMSFYSQVDVVVISLLVNEKNVGWYGQAAQLFGTFLFIPLVYNTAIYPSLARMYAREPDALNKVMRKSFDLMLILGVPVGLGVMIISDNLVVTLFGQQFYGSGPVLAFMGLVLTITYQNMLLGRYYMAIDRQKKYTMIMAIALFITIPVDILIIPWLAQHYGNGAVGGGISYLLTELFIMIASLVLMPRNVLTSQTAVTAAKTVVAGLAMVACTWWLRSAFLAIPIVLGGAVYVAMILLLRVVPPDDWKILRLAWSSILARISRRPSQPVDIP